MAKFLILIKCLLVISINTECNKIADGLNSLEKSKIEEFEDCCDELRSENVQRKMEISQLTEQTSICLAIQIYICMYIS